MNKRDHFNYIEKLFKITKHPLSSVSSYSSPHYYDDPTPIHFNYIITSHSPPPPFNSRIFEDLS